MKKIHELRHGQTDQQLDPNEVGDPVANLASIGQYSNIHFSLFSLLFSDSVAIFFE